MSNNTYISNNKILAKHKKQIRKSFCEIVCKLNERLKSVISGVYSVDDFIFIDKWIEETSDIHMREFMTHKIGELNNLYNIRLQEAIEQDLIFIDRIIEKIDGTKNIDINIDGYYRILRNIKLKSNEISNSFFTTYLRNSDLSFIKKSITYQLIESEHIDNQTLILSKKICDDKYFFDWKIDFSENIYGRTIYKMHIIANYLYKQFPCIHMYEFGYRQICTYMSFFDITNSGHNCNVLDNINDIYNDLIALVIGMDSWDTGTLYGYMRANSAGYRDSFGEIDRHRLLTIPEYLTIFLKKYYEENPISRSSIISDDMIFSDVKDLILKDLSIIK